MARTRRPDVGDIFTIPLQKSTVAVGQVLDRLGEQLLVVVARGEHPADEVPPEVAECDVALLGITLDALFMHRRWLVVANSKEPPAIPYPTFKVATRPDEWVKESFHGEQLGSVSTEEASTLPFRKVVAPVRIDRATKALHGHLRWEAQYDDLLYTRP